MESVNKDVEEPPPPVVAEEDIEKPVPEQEPSVMDIIMEKDEETASNASLSSEETPTPEQGMTSGRNNQKMRIVVTATMLLLVLAAILIGVLVPAANKNATTSQADKSMAGGCNTQYFESTEGPFQVKAPSFNPDIFDVYKDAGEATQGFEDMAKLLINNAVNRFLGVPGYENAGEGNGSWTDSDDEGGATVDTTADSAKKVTGGAAAATISGNGKVVGDDVNGWETNNQDDRMDRADIAKSDGKYIYTAYEDTVWVFRTTQAQDGEKQIVTELKLPPPDSVDIAPCYSTTTCNDQGVCTTCDCKGKCKVHTANPNSDSTMDEGDTIASAIADSGSEYIDPWYIPKPNVDAILLGEDRLVLVVTGYGYVKQALMGVTCVNDYLATQIRLYSTADLETTGELHLIGIQDVHGIFQEAYMIENVMHLVNMASINTYDYLVHPVDRYSYSNSFSGLNDTDYKEAVNEMSGKVIENFTTCLVDELNITGSFPKVARLAIMADGSANNVSLGKIMPEGYGSSIAQITSLNIVNYTLVEDTSATDDVPRLQVEQTLQIIDSWLGLSFSAEDMIVIAGEGSHWSASGGTQQQTYLFAFLLHDVYSVPLSSGTIPGTLVNQYALYYENGYFRAATTTQIDIYDPTVYGTPLNWGSSWDDDFYYDDYSYTWTYDDTVVDQGDDALDMNMSRTSAGGARKLQQVAPPESVNNNDLSSLTNATDKPTLSRLISSCFEMSDCPDQAQTCQGYMDLGCSQVFYSPESCNLYCWDRYEELVDRSGCPKPGDPCLGEDDFLKCVESYLDPWCSSYFNLQSDVCPYVFEFPCDASSATYSPTSIVSYTNTYTSSCSQLPETSGCNHDQQETTCLSLEDGGCTDIRIFDDCRVECFVPPASLTENNVYSLFPNENKKLEVTGKVNIGLKDEEIFAVRFFKNFAYTVTHEYTDPLYAISFADPAMPTVMGEVKTTGFSSYLHSINLNDTMLLGVGKESDEYGNPYGLKFFMFDVTDAADPKLVTSYLFDDAYSETEYEEKSFRYVSLFEGEGMGTGILILPVTSWGKYDGDDDSSTYFDGFKVLKVTFDNAAGTGSIEPLYDVSHTDYCNDYCPYLQERSFVVNGDLVTMMGSSVRSHDLENGALKWMVNF